MRLCRYFILLTIGFTLALNTSAPAFAARPKLKGKIVSDSPADFKVVGLSKGGASKIASVRSNGKFQIVAQKNATLHLVTTSGRYFGPLGSAKGSRFYGRLSGMGGNVGRVKVKDGFAVAKYTGNATEIFSRKRLPFNSETGPRGAGRFGLVATGTSELHTAAADGDPAGLGDDTDRDGLPDTLDIDDDGDLILDITDEVFHESSAFEGETFSTLRLGLSDSLNVNIGATSQEDIDRLIEDNLIMSIFMRNNSDATVSAINVDCQSLTYCAPGAGTARIHMDNPPAAANSLWTDYDPDADGFPNIGLDSGRQFPEIGIKPHASTSQLRTGDTIFLKATTSDGEQTVPIILPFFFVSSPALKSYNDNGTIHTISYPVADNGAGTGGNPFMLQTNSVGLTFWKPQRSAVEGAEAPGFIDIGRLKYGVYLSVNGDNNVYTCNADEYSAPSSNLDFLSPTNGAEVLEDNELDAPASATSLLEYTLDMGACLSRQGVAPSGKTIRMDLVATSHSHDQTSQTLYFLLP